MPDIAAEAMTLVIDLPTKTVTSITELVRAISMALSTVSGNPNGGGMSGVVKKVVDAASQKVDEAKEALTPAVVDDLRMIKRRASTHGADVDVMTIWDDFKERLGDSMDELRKACNTFGIKIAVIPDEERGCLRLAVSSDEARLASEAIVSACGISPDDPLYTKVQKAMEKGAAKVIGNKAVDKIHEEAERVAKGAEPEHVLNLEEVRAGEAKLLTMLDDEEQSLSLDVDAYRKEHGLDKESVRKITTTYNDRSYTFVLRRDDLNRTCWCCDMEDDVRASIDPAGHWTFTRFGKPLNPNSGEDVLNDLGDPWPCRGIQGSVTFRHGNGPRERFEGTFAGLEMAAMNAAQDMEKIMCYQAEANCTFEAAALAVMGDPKDLEAYMLASDAMPSQDAIDQAFAADERVPLSMYDSDFTEAVAVPLRPAELEAAVKNASEKSTQGAPKEVAKILDEWYPGSWSFDAENLSVTVGTADISKSLLYFHTSEQASDPSAWSVAAQVKGMPTLAFELGTSYWPEGTVAALDATFGEGWSLKNGGLQVDLGPSPDAGHAKPVTLRFANAAEAADPAAWGAKLKAAQGAVPKQAPDEAIKALADKINATPAAKGVSR